MGLLLPPELLTSLEDSCICRSTQVRQLTALYNDLCSPPPNLVVYGLQGTGKLHTVSSVLSARELPHAIVKSRECLSLRHLLSKIHTACIGAVYEEGEEAAGEAYERRTDSVNALSVNLQRLLRGRDRKLVLVLDGVDKQRGLNPTTLPALVRLSDIIPNLCLILIVTTPRALFLQKAGIPQLHFPPYSRAEAISLVVRSAPTLAPQAHLSEHQDLPALQKWYSLFATTVYDSLFSPTSLSQSHFQRTCKTLWPRFIWPYVNGEKSPGRGKNAQWDFPKLLVRQRALFQRAGEDALAPKLLPKAQAMTFDELLQQETEENSIAGKENPTTTTTTTSLTLFKPFPSKPPLALLSQSVPKNSTPLLSLLPTLVLTAAYLASHTPPKLDILLFSRLSSSSRSARVKKSYHRRKLFQSPSRTRAGADGGGGGVSGVSGEAGGGVGRGGGSPKKKRLAVGKSGLEMNLNLPRAFTLERLVAIFRAIHPAGVSRARSVVDRISSAVAELERLRLLVPSDSSGGGSGTRTLGDDGGGEERRWRVNVPRGFVEELGGWYERDGVSGVVREFELLEG